MMRMRTCATFARRTALPRHRTSVNGATRAFSSSPPSSSLSTPRQRRRLGAWVLLGAAGTVPSMLFLRPSSSNHDGSNGLEPGPDVVDNARLTLRLGTLLATVLWQRCRRGDAVDDEWTIRGDAALAYRDAVAMFTQVLRGNDARAVHSSPDDLDFQGRLVELLANRILEAGSDHDDEERSGSSSRQLLHALAGSGVVDALLQYLARAKPTNATLTQRVVDAIEVLLSLANNENESEPNARCAFGISIDTLGAALSHLLDVQALRFTDLLRLGEQLCNAQQRSWLMMDQQQGQHFQVPQWPRTDFFAESVDGFLRLLSPEMPSSIKQFSLWALTSMLRAAENVPERVRSDVLSAVLGPACATLLLTLPHANHPLQLQAAAFMNVVLHLAQQNASLVERSTYELWMKQIRYWSTCSSNPSLLQESALCLRTLSSHPCGRRYMSESAPTMTALYEFARRLHEEVQVLSKSQKLEQDQGNVHPKQVHRRSPARQLSMDIGEIRTMQNYVSCAFRNICTSFQTGETAIASIFANPSSSSLLLHSKRNLPMSRVFRGTLDLNDLPILGAEEYESSTEFGWIDILTSWTGSSHRDVRLNAIESLVHLAEHHKEPPLGTNPQGNEVCRRTQDHILQAWLTSMLQHIRYLHDGGEILAVKQVEDIAKLSHELTPGNEKVLFNPAVVDAGAAALAVLAEKHCEELIQQGVIPLMALLGTSDHSSEEYDLKTQCSRVLANLVAASCAELSAHYEKHIPMLLSMKDRYDRRSAWKTFVAQNYDVHDLLLQTPSGKRFLREVQHWGNVVDPQQRSSYFRVVANMGAYRDFVAAGRLENDIYCEGVHPIVPFNGAYHVGNIVEPETEEVEDTKTYPDADSKSSGENGKPSIDIVFVHGLRGHPFGTWRTDMGNSLDGKNEIWPDVLLAKDLEQRHVNARLITLGYEAGMVSWSSPWPTLTLQERGSVMLDALRAANIGESKRPDRRANPIVFVTHSMGGILVKKMLLLAKEQAQQQSLASKMVDDNLAASTKGVVFLAVPHFGSDLAKGVRSESVRKLIQAHPAIQDLCADYDGRLEALNDAFRGLGIDCMSIGEAKPAPLGFGISAIVVKPESADPRFGSFHILADSDHMTICKAKRADEPHYQAILHYILESEYQTREELIWQKAPRFDWKMAGSEVQSVPSEPIFGKKFMSKLGGMANESAASTVSDFARRQMEKMGWKEGKGLGKEEQGVVTHVRVKKREESMGIGVEKLNVEEQKSQWWYNAYDKIADKIKIAPDSDDENGGDARSKKSKKKASKKKRKRDAEAANGDDADSAREKKFRIPTDEELFAATGGKLFGRRAYGSCNGKLKRDELLQSGKFELKEEKKSEKEQDTTSSSSNNSSESEDKDDKPAKKKSKGKKRKSSKKSKQEEERSESE
ncbi:hypothetical protein FI667_g3209, partial [Globisporangium splendens]